MFKKAVIVLLLLTTPFAQARAVLICSMMNDQVVEKCCCPGHTEHHMPAQPDAPDASCCDVVVAVSDKVFAGITSEQTTPKRIAHDVPDVAIVAAPVPLLTDVRRSHCGRRPTRPMLRSPFPTASISARRACAYK